MRILTAFAVPSALALALIAGPGFAQDKPAADVSPKPGSGAPKSAPANKSTATKASSSKLAPDRTGTLPRQGQRRLTRKRKSKLLAEVPRTPPIHRIRSSP